MKHTVPGPSIPLPKPSPDELRAVEPTFVRAAGGGVAFGVLASVVVFMVDGKPTPDPLATLMPTTSPVSC